MKRAEEIAKELNNSGEWIPNLCEELCNLAGMDQEWKSANGENFESVLYEAAEKLGVEI